MTDKKTPEFVGMAPDPTDPVAGYAKGVAERRKAVQERNHHAGLPPIHEVDAVWKAGEDGAATPAQLRDNLAALKAEKTDGPAEGIDALRQTKTEADAHNVAAAQVEANAKDFFKEVDKSAEEGAEAELAEGVDAETEAALEKMDKLRLTNLMSQITSDPINNAEQRELADNAANAEDPLNVGDVISRGEAWQWVPVNPGLRIRFRQTSPWEEQEIRKIIAAQVEKGDIPDTLAGEVFGLMSMVASIKNINDTELASHVTKIGGSTTFDEATFIRNYNHITRMPAGMVHMLSTHAWWFDRRARQLFTMAEVKNG